LKKLNNVPGIRSTSPESVPIVAHNHPSGELTPSKEDIEITKQLKSAGEIVGIRLLDHIIFNDRGYYSLLEKGEI
jgi:DNA repair protein RadC